MSELLIDNATQKSNKRLLEDTASVFSLTPDYIEKSEKINNGKVILTGVFSKPGVPNQNKRIYPKHILEREVNKLLPLIRDNQLTGQLDHPQTSVVEFATTSHKIIDLWFDENGTLYGKLQIIRDHPSGQKVLALIKEEVKIGISSRALGSTESVSLHQEYSQYPDAEVVGEDLTLITYDIVQNPSNFGSFLTPITENLMLEWNNQRINSLPKNNYSYSNYDKELIEFIQKYKK